MQLVVGTDGTPHSIRITKSAADAYTDPADREAALTLDQKAIDAVSQYRFSPGTSQGKPVPV